MALGMGLWELSAACARLSRMLVALPRGRRGTAVDSALQQETIGLLNVNRNGLSRCLFALVSTGLLGACSLVARPMPDMATAVLISESTPVIVPTVKPIPSIADGLTDSERLRHAIALLEQGNSEQARAELGAYLEAVPDSVTAQRLLFQIDAPLATLYPTDHFTVELQSTESLSSLSGHYLNEVLGFYGLARYNGISNPSRVVAGQSIRIPATPAALAARDTKRAIALAPGGVEAPALVATPEIAEVAADPWEMIVEYIDAGRFGAAVLEAEAAGLAPDGERAGILATAYEGVARELGSNAKLLAGTRALRAGQLYMDADRPRDALPMFDFALELTPGSTSARALRDQARESLVAAEYHAGLRAFQREQLDDAIAHFDRALEIDPTHRDATINRAQAVELRTTSN